MYDNISVNESKMAKQAKTEDIMILTVNGLNYSSWRIKLMLLLEYKECNQPVVSIGPSKVYTITRKQTV